MRFNMPGRRREFARVAELLGEDIRGLDDAAAADRSVEAVERLQTDIGIPRRLRDLGVKDGQLPEFAVKAAAIKRILRVNPRPVTPADCETIYRAAL
jgi:alcohol dehydrogenase class IV